MMADDQKNDYLNVSDQDEQTDVDDFPDFGEDDQDDDDLVALMFDNGSSMFKCGYVGDDAPRALFPTVVGRRLKRHPLVVQSFERTTRVGHAATAKSAGILVRTYPIERGIITNWDDMQRIWNHAFYNELRVAPEEHPIVLSEAPLNPKPNREKTTQMFFEVFNSPAFYLCNQARLALFATGKTTGIVLDSGEGVTHAVPIYESYALPHATLRLDVAGGDVTKYLNKMLMEQGHKFTTYPELKVVRNIKERRGYVALNFELESKERKPTKRDLYELPDGTHVSVGNMRFRFPEVMFNPALIDYGYGQEVWQAVHKHKKTKSQYCLNANGVTWQCSKGLYQLITHYFGRDVGGIVARYTLPTEPGVHNLIYKSIMQCDEDLHKKLFNNIVLNGGNTMFHGFAKRMHKELTALAPPNMKVRVIAPRYRRYNIWIGGSVMASRANFQSRWIVYDSFSAASLHVATYSSVPISPLISVR